MQLECLLEQEQMLSTIIALHCLLDRGFVGTHSPIRQVRQLFGIPLPGEDGLDHAQPAHPGDVA